MGGGQPSAMGQQPMPGQGLMQPPGQGMMNPMAQSMGMGGMQQPQGMGASPMVQQMMQQPGMGPMTPNAPGQIPMPPRRPPGLGMGLPQNVAAQVNMGGQGGMGGDWQPMQQGGISPRNSMGASPPERGGGSSGEAGGGSLYDYARQASAHMPADWRNRFLATGMGESGWRNIPGDYGVGGPGPHSFGPLQFLDRGMLRTAGLSANDPDLGRKEIDYVVSHPSILNPNIFHAMNGQNSAYNNALARLQGGRPLAGVGGSSGRGGGVASGPFGGRGSQDPMTQLWSNAPVGQQTGVMTDVAHRILSQHPSISGNAFVKAMNTIAPWMRLDVDSIAKEHRMQMDELRLQQQAERAAMQNQMAQERLQRADEKEQRLSQGQSFKQNMDMARQQLNEMKEQHKQDMDALKFQQAQQSADAKLNVAQAKLALERAKFGLAQQREGRLGASSAERLRQGQGRLELQQQREGRLSRKDTQGQAFREYQQAIKEAQNEMNRVAQMAGQGVDPSAIQAWQQQYRAKIDALQKEYQDAIGGQGGASPAASTEPQQAPQAPQQQQAPAAPSPQSQTYGGPAGSQGSDMPQAGAVMDGYRFKGGDPADQKNWEEVK